MKATDKKGDCEFCSNTDVWLFPQHGDMMCKECIERENAVAAATKVVVESRGQDDRIQLKDDIMQAQTTAFIELQGAIFSNPDLSDADKRVALVTEAASRIAKMDAVIFAHDAEGLRLKNERMIWLKNTQGLVATLRSDEREKFKNLNASYRPSAPSVDVIRGTRTTGGKKSKSPKTGQKKYSHKDIQEACEKYKADITTVKMMMIAKNISPLEAAQKYAEKMASN